MSDNREGPGDILVLVGLYRDSVGALSIVRLKPNAPPPIIYGKTLFSAKWVKFEEGHRDG